MVVDVCIVASASSVSPVVTNMAIADSASRNIPQDLGKSRIEVNVMARLWVNDYTSEYIYTNYTTPCRCCLFMTSLVIQSAFMSAAAFLVSFTRRICTLSIYLILRNLTLLDEVLLAKGLLDPIDGNDAFVPGDGDRALGAHLGVDAHGEAPGQR